MTRVTKAAIACFVLMGGLTLGSAAASAQSSSSGGSIQVWLTPSLTGKGGKILIPAEKIGYVELNGTEQHRIGFGNL